MRHNKIPKNAEMLEKVSDLCIRHAQLHLGAVGLIAAPWLACVHWAIQSEGHDDFVDAIAGCVAMEAPVARYVHSQGEMVRCQFKVAVGMAYVCTWSTHRVKNSDGTDGEDTYVNVREHLSLPVSLHASFVDSDPAQARREFGRWATRWTREKYEDDRRPAPESDGKKIVAWNLKISGDGIAENEPVRE